MSNIIEASTENNSPDADIKVESSECVANSIKLFGKEFNITKPELIVVTLLSIYFFLNYSYFSLFTPFFPGIPGFLIKNTL